MSNEGYDSDNNQGDKPKDGTHCYYFILFILLTTYFRVPILRNCFQSWREEDPEPPPLGAGDSSLLVTAEDDARAGLDQEHNLSETVHPPHEENL